MLLSSSTFQKKPPRFNYSSNLFCQKRRKKEASHGRQIPTGLFLPNMSDCSAWDVTPRNNSGNVKKCKKTPRKTLWPFVVVVFRVSKFPCLQFVVMPSFGTRTSSSLSPVDLSPPPHVYVPRPEWGSRLPAAVLRSARDPRCGGGYEGTTQFRCLSL